MRSPSLATIESKLILSTDIKSLTESNPEIISELSPAFQKYNEEQFTTVKLPGSSQSVSGVDWDMHNRFHADLELQVLVSSHNSLGGGQYFDVESSSSFSFDHITQKASNATSYVLEGAQADLVYVRGLVTWLLWWRC